MTTDLYQARVKEPAPGAPLVLALHGTGGDENQFYGLVEQMLPKAGIISPRGDVLEQGAARFFRRTGEGVYDMDDLARRTKQMAAYVRAHKEAQPDAPLYAFGYSNGANILASLLMRYPDLVDRAGLLHPLIPWEPSPTPGLEGKRVLITAGRRDPICPLPLSEALIGWFGDQRAEVETSIHDGGHELRATEVAALQAFLS